MAATKEKKHAMTPKEKVESLVRQYLVALDKAKANPGDQKMRDAANIIKSHIKNRCTSFHLTMPELDPLPALPDPVLREKATPAPSMEEEIAEAMKLMPPTTAVGKDRDLPPAPTTTPAQAREVTQETIQAAETHRAALGLPMEPAAIPGKREGVLNAEEFRRQWEEGALSRTPTPDSAPDQARSIQRLFWPLCQAIESLPNREQIRPALDVIHARLQTAYALLDEASLSDAG